MLPQLTEEQRQAFEEAAGLPVCVVDYQNLNKYVLIDADDFERFLNVVFEHDPDAVDHLL